MKKSKEMRSKILEEFNRQIYLHGYEKTTLKGIGKELQISTGHIYYYFKKKEELYLALNMDLISKILLIINELPLQKLNPVVKILFLEYITHMLRHEKSELRHITYEIVCDSHLCDEYSKQYVKLYQKAFDEQDLNISSEQIAIAVYDAFAIYWTRIRLGKNKILPLDMEELSHSYFHELLSRINLQEEQQDAIEQELRAVLKVVDIHQIIEKIYEMDAYNYEEI